MVKQGKGLFNKAAKEVKKAEPKGKGLFNKAAKEVKKAEPKGKGLFNKAAKEVKKAEPQQAKQVKRGQTPKPPAKPLQQAKRAVTQVGALVVDCTRFNRQKVLLQSTLVLCGGP